MLFARGFEIGYGALTINVKPNDAVWPAELTVTMGMKVPFIDAAVAPNVSDPDGFVSDAA
jgi:hypothetical protein